MGKVKSLLLDNDDIIGVNDSYDDFEAIHYMKTINDFVELINTYSMQTVMMDLFEYIKNNKDLYENF